MSKNCSTALTRRPGSCSSLPSGDNRSALTGVVDRRPRPATGASADATASPARPPRLAGPAPARDVDGHDHGCRRDASPPTADSRRRASTLRRACCGESLAGNVRDAARRHPARHANPAARQCSGRARLSVRWCRAAPGLDLRPGLRPGFGDAAVSEVSVSMVPVVKIRIRLAGLRVPVRPGPAFRHRQAESYGSTSCFLVSVAGDRRVESAVVPAGAARPMSRRSRGSRPTRRPVPARRKPAHSAIAATP